MRLQLTGAPFYSLRFMPFILVVSAALGAMSTTILTPALPAMATEFHADDAAVQKILSLNLLSIALSGLVYGFLSEIIGRRILFLFGFSIFSIGSFLSFQAGSIKTLQLMQIIQGCGAGVGAVLPLAIVKDLYSGKRATQIISILGISVPLSPALSPFLGGYITEYYGWRGNFFCLTLVSCVLTILLFLCFRETLHKDQRHVFSFKGPFQRYYRTLKNPSFTRFAALPCVGFAGVWMYNTSAPFIFIEEADLKPSQYGMYAIFSVAGVILGNLIVNRMTSRWPLLSFLRYGAILTCLGSLGILGLTLLGSYDILFYTMSMFTYCVGFGSIFSASLSMAMDQARYGKGYGSALIRSSQILCAAGGVALTAKFYNGTFLEPSLAIIVCVALLNLLIWTAPTQKEIQQ